MYVGLGWYVVDIRIFLELTHCDHHFTYIIQYYHDYH